MKITPRDVPLDLLVIGCPIPYNRDGASSFLQKPKSTDSWNYWPGAGRKHKIKPKVSSPKNPGPILGLLETDEAF